MAKFRKKPVVIEAALWDGHSSAAVREILGIPLGDDRIEVDGSELLIHTLEGCMTAQSGDWIIRGVKGEVYPCKPDIFAATYDPAD